MRNASNAHKTEEFLEIYERHFAPIKDNKIDMLEIGVQQGGSLDIWRNFFRGDFKLTGVDILPSCEVYATNGVTIKIGDQADPEFLATLGNYDIIIDDGGHKMSQQRTSFEHLFPKLNSGGIYVIEDLHTSYWGEFTDELPMTETLKTFVDDINAWATCPGNRSTQKSIINKYDIASMHVYESIVLIYKK